MARQEEECRATRAREIKDRGSVNALMEEILEKKERFFREKLSEMKAETLEWKSKYCGLSKLIDETVAEFAAKEREFKEKCVKVEEENRDLKARLLRVPEENCPDLTKHASETDEDLVVIVDSDSEDDHDDRVPLSRYLAKKRLAEVRERGKKDLDHSSRASGAKEASLDEEDVQIPLGSAIKREKGNHGGTSSMKKYKKSGLSCLSKERGSAGRSRVCYLFLYQLKKSST
ncbi:uncharacterized protein A4U43_C06F13520 [Asparagus officinalis]|uniref:Uncharacterized protein n=1 Tax=Asparagus officinalis TaxID=4686 RepID=A0A5P1EMA6_ASPOF|nr:uncharacterized protein A4U43_C06F13520 [Asparagus officinalis]